MAKYRSIDWKQSPPHVDFLNRFKKPRSRKDQARADYLKPQLKEDVDQTIQRFVDEGVLIAPTLAEAIDGLHNKPIIEGILREHDLKSTGNKPHLIQRLVHNLPDKALALVGEHDLLICSEKAVEFLEDYDNRKREAEKLAKRESFLAFGNLDGKKAYEVYVQYQRTYGNVDVYGGGNYHAEVIEIVLKDNPQLLDHLTERNKRFLRAATAMTLLWSSEPALSWLPKDFSTIYADGTVASNLLRKYAEIRRQLIDADEEDKYEISFDDYDVDSCDLCRKHNGQIYTVNDFPELPNPKCSSEKGCQCDVRRHWEYSSWDYDDYEGESEASTSEMRQEIIFDFEKLLDFDALNEIIAKKVEEFVAENLEIKLDPVSKLRALKQMHDEGLITSKEFEETKQRILSAIN